MRLKEYLEKLRRLGVPKDIIIQTAEAAKWAYTYETLTRLVVRWLEERGLTYEAKRVRECLLQS